MKRKSPLSNRRAFLLHYPDLEVDFSNGPLWNPLLMNEPLRPKTVPLILAYPFHFMPCLSEQLHQLIFKACIRQGKVFIHISLQEVLIIMILQC